MTTDTLPAAPDLDPEVRLDLTARLPHAIRRVSLDQFDRIAHALGNGDLDAGVHVARKALKRQRALLRLVRDEVGYGAYRNENVVLRDVGRLLAPARDAYAQIATLDKLRDAYAGTLQPAAFATTRAYLDEAYAAAHHRVFDDPAVMVHVRITLGAARSRLAHWDPASAAAPDRPLAARAIGDGYDGIGAGLHRVYRRGRQAMHRAYEEGTEEAFHEWRKRVKYLRYQLEALEPIWPELLAAHAARLDDLGELLGDEHDLAVLGETVLHDDDATADQRERTLLLALVHRSRLELQWQARPLGRALYAETPKQFVRRIGAYFDAARG